MTPSNKPSDSAVTPPQDASKRLLFIGIALCIAFLALLAIRPGHKAAPSTELAANAKPVGDEMPSANGSLYGMYLAAHYASERDDARYASAALNQALARSPEDPLLLGLAMDSALLAGKMDDAFALAKRIDALPVEIRQNEGFAMVRLLELVQDLGQSRLDDAEKLLAPEIDKPGGLPSFQQLLYSIADAWVLQGKGDSAGADARMQKLKTFPDLQPFVEYHRAVIQAAGGQAEASEATLEHVVVSAPILPRRVAEIYANLLRHDGKKAESDALIARFWKQNRDIWLEQEEIQGLLDGYGDKLAISTPQEGMAELLYGASSLAHQQGDEALGYRFLHLALYLRPDFPIAKILLAAYMERDKRFSGAIEIYKTIDDKSPFSKRAQMEWAQSEAELGDKSAALKRLDKVAGRFPNSPLPWLHKGDLLRQEQRYAEAADAYAKGINKITEVKEYFWPVYYMRGICYERSNQWDKAEADFSKALELSPHNPDVMNYLAYSWLDMGRNIEQAKSMLSEAVSAAPEEGHIVDSMGWAWFKSGDYDKALLYLQKAVTLMPDDATVNEHLGDIYWKLGREREAKFQWERALKEKPEPKAEKAMKEKLEKGLPQ